MNKAELIEQIQKNLGGETSKRAAGEGIAAKERNQMVGPRCVGAHFSAGGGGGT